MMKKYCIHCGAELSDGARFCEKCGAAVQTGTIPSRVSAEPVRAMSAPISTVPLSPSYAFGPSGKIRGTAAVLFSQIGRMIGGMFKIFTKFKALLFTAAISALWIWLNHLRLLDSLDGVFAVLAKVTYSRGGTGGTILQIIGGTIGKGIVGAALCSILYGGIGKAVRGVGNIFSEPGFNLGAALLGFGFSGIAYAFTAGFAGEDGIPVGIAGAVLSLEALSGRNGFLVDLAASFSARKVTDGRMTGKILLPGRYKGFLTGSVLGFPGWMLLTIAEKAEELTTGARELVPLELPDGLIPYLVPAALLLVGMILNAIGKGKGADRA